MDHHDFLATFLELPNGIPAHDTFNRVFRYLDPEAFANCFVDWINAISARLHLRTDLMPHQSAVDEAQGEMRSGSDRQMGIKVRRVKPAHA